MKKINIKDHKSPEVAEQSKKDRAKFDAFRTKKTLDQKYYDQIEAHDKMIKENLNKTEKVHKKKQRMVSKWG